MDLADQDRLWLAREVARSLGKGLEASRRAGATPAEPPAELVRSLRGYVRRHGRFQLRASATGLAIGSDALPDEQGRFAALGTELLVGGIRELLVEPGVTEEEVQGLLEALVGTEGDAATRLIDAGLDHVDVRSLEFVPALDRPEGYSADATAKLQELQKQADELAKEFEARGAADKAVVPYELTDSGGEFALIPKIPPPRARPADEGPPPPAVAAEAVLALRARMLEASSHDALLLSLLDSVLQALSLDPTAIGPDHARWFLELTADQALRDGDVALLAAIAERLTSELTVAEGHAAAIIQAVLERLSSERGIERLVAIASSGADPKAFCALLEALGEAAVAAALATHQRTRSKELKEALGAFLAEAIAQRPAALEPLLQPTASVEAAKFALFLVSRGLEGPVADALYEAGKKHPQAAVSEYAAFLSRTHTTRGRLTALLESLEQDDVALRIEAVNLLARAKDQPALEALVKIVQDPSFLNRTPEEMHAFMNAISAIGGPAMIQFFEEQSARSSGMFRIRAGNEVRGTAKEVLKRLTGEGEKA